MPEVQRRGVCTPRQRRQRRTWASADFLRLLAISRLRFHHALHAHCGAVSQVRSTFHCREKLENRQSARLPEGRLRLGEACARSPACGTRRGSRTCRSEVLTNLPLRKHLRKLSSRTGERAYTVSGFSLVCRWE